MTVTDLSSAIATIDDGATVGLAGFAITRNAVAAAHELIRAGRRELTLVQVVGGIETDLLVAAGCVRSLHYSGGSLDRFGPLHAVNRAISDGSLTAFEYSSLSLTLRLTAAWLGLPFLPCCSMLGSQLLKQLLDAEDSGVQLGSDPFTGGAVVLLRALHPDVTIVHADRADSAGNAEVSGPTWALRETALAARRVIVVCEELVPVGAIDPRLVTLPGLVVDLVVPVQYAALPTAVHGRYDYDRDHLIRYAAAAAAGGTALRDYLDDLPDYHHAGLQPT